MRTETEVKAGERTHSISVETWNDDGDEIIITVPTKRIVCGRCDGSGTHVNPSIDGNGLSAEDFEDEDFREGYFSGRYDVTCEECRGRNVVDVVDADRCSEEQLRAWHDHLESLRPCAIQEMERRMGA